MSDRGRVLSGLGAGLGRVTIALGAILRRLIPRSRTRPGALSGVCLEPTPQCAGDGQLDVQSHQPFELPDSPCRADLRPADCADTQLILTGRVLNTRGQPIADALLDFWHGETFGREHGVFHGHQFTDDNGRFQLTTIRPDAFRNPDERRVPRMYVRVQAPSTRRLTTQLFFPDARVAAHRDQIHDPSLKASYRELSAQSASARFDFVLMDA